MEEGGKARKIEKEKGREGWDERMEEEWKWKKNVRRAMMHWQRPQRHSITLSKVLRSFHQSMTPFFPLAIPIYHLWLLRRIGITMGIKKREFNTLNSHKNEKS